MAVRARLASPSSGADGGAFMDAGNEERGRNGGMERRMLRIWGIWLVASALVGLAMGLKWRARSAVLAGAAAGALAFAFNWFQGDSFSSSFWSLVAAGSGLLVGGLIGAAIISAMGGDRPGG